jgi:hypothetical protein
MTADGRDPRFARDEEKRREENLKKDLTEDEKGALQKLRGALSRSPWFFD